MQLNQCLARFLRFKTKGTQHHAFLWLLLPIVVVVVGCSKFDNQYGETSGLSGRGSINGFAGFRNLFDQRSYRTRSATLLTRRLDRTGTIVWVPRVSSAIPAETSNWMEDWLAKGDRTLIYVIPDGGSEPEYWRATASLAPAETRLEYRRRMANSELTEFERRLKPSYNLGNDWLRAKYLSERVPPSQFSGEWGEEVQQGDSPLAGAMETEVVFGKRVREESEEGSEEESEFPAMDNSNRSANGADATGLNGIMMQMVDREVHQSKVDLTFQELLAISDKGPPSRSATLVAAVNAEKWNNSRIIVVAGGSMLTNFGLINAPNRVLASKLVDQAGTASDSVVFITSQDGYVDTITPEEQVAIQTKGMELLVVPPLSIVNLHALYLGMVLCLALFPIFGRPRKLSSGTKSDFTDHLNSIAVLMTKDGDTTYARNRISEYMRRVRGETKGPWVLSHAAPGKEASSEDAIESGTSAGKKVLPMRIQRKGNLPAKVDYTPIPSQTGVASAEPQQAKSLQAEPQQVEQPSALPERDVSESASQQVPPAAPPSAGNSEGPPDVPDSPADQKT